MIYSWSSGILKRSIPVLVNHCSKTASTTTVADSCSYRIFDTNSNGTDKYYGYKTSFVTDRLSIEESLDTAW